MTEAEIKPQSQPQLQFYEHRIYEGIYEIFESELVEIGRYIAFTEDNLQTYSNKIHELHLRVCSEMENILKIVIHKHFVDEKNLKIEWENKKSSFLNEQDRSVYAVLKSKLNREREKDLDKILYGFPDFSFYFSIACKKFRLDQKVVQFLSGLTNSEQLNILQPFEQGERTKMGYSSSNKN